MQDDLATLRLEVARLLDVALTDEARHVADIERRDQAYLDELDARDVRHGIEVDNFHAALETRDVLGQAKGVIMASLGCSADEAFALIVRQSQHQNRKAIDVAREIVARTQRHRAHDGAA